MSPPSSKLMKGLIKSTGIVTGDLENIQAH